MGFDKVLELVISSFLGFIVAFILFQFQEWRNRKLLKQELYQRLELQSIELFRHENERMDIAWKLYDNDQKFPHKGTKEYQEMVNHVTQILNLFEMNVEFRKKNIIGKDIFTTWVKWYFEISQLPNFRKLWKHIKWHYTPDLQKIMEAGIEARNWDDFIDKLDKIYDCHHIRALSVIDDIPVPSFSLANMGELSFSRVNTGEYDLNILADFFAKNVEWEYISHGEVIDGRANSFSEWKPDIRQIMIADFEKALPPAVAGENYSQLYVCKSGKELSGLALVEYKPDTSVAILADIVMSSENRSRGTGSKFLEWIQLQVHAAGVKRLFIESGKNNHGAHDFFEKHHFHKTSIVMVREF